MASLATIDYQDIDSYASKKAAKYGMKGNFTGKDSDGNEIEPSGSGKNVGKYTLKDVRKCLKVQEWIEENKVEGEKEEKKVNTFSSKAAEKLFKEKFPEMDVKDWKGRSGKRTKGSITCDDIKNFIKTSGVTETVSYDKKFTNYKMKEKIDVLGNTLKVLAKEYLEQNPGSYKSTNVLWGKKEVEAAIKYAMENLN